MASQSVILDYNHDYPIDLTSFDLPGLGSEGPKCGVDRMSDFSEDGDAVKYSPLRCGRIECPKCWTDWAKRRTFDVVVRLTAYGIVHGEKRDGMIHSDKPYPVVMSVPPDQVKDRWDWARVNTSLFRRGYRRISDVGIDGGGGFFHPYRLRRKVKLKLQRGGYGSGGWDAGYWKEIRRRANEGARLYDFVKVGPHAHGLVFGDPQAHGCDDYLIRFKEEEGDGSRPHRLELEERIALSFYLVTHIGTLTHLKKYGDGVRKQETQPIRWWGSLHHFNPKDALIEEFGESVGLTVYHMVCKVVASKITVKRGDEELSMKWNSQEEKLEYPASAKEFGTSDEEITWISIHKLWDYVEDEVWFNNLTEPQKRYWLEVLKFMKQEGAPPELGDLEAPDSVTVYSTEPEEESGVASGVKKFVDKILDVFKLSDLFRFCLRKKLEGGEKGGKPRGSRMCRDVDRAQVRDGY